MRKTSFNASQCAIYAVFVCATLTFWSGSLAAQTPSTPAPTEAPLSALAKSTLTIHIAGFHNAKGKANIALFRDAKGFPTDIAMSVASQRLEIDPQTLSVTAVFKNIPQGSYAVAILHDENLTGKMEFDAQGIPQEGYGLSNNPDTSQGPPTPAQATFAVNQAESAIEIKMTYWQ
jgi:uncharacterized protein (DUF2141 family)